MSVLSQMSIIGEFSVDIHEFYTFNIVISILSILTTILKLILSMFASANFIYP